jgi:hypothetical protein
MRAANTRGALDLVVLASQQLSSECFGMRYHGSHIQQFLIQADS